MVEKMAERTTTTNSTSVVRSLNDFPDNILLHILSSLPTTVEAIETSLFSRKWRNLWLSVPSLNFSCHSFFTPNVYPDPESLQSFIYFVEHTLILRPPNSPLFSLKMQFDFSDLKFTSHVDSWIRFAIATTAQNLDFDLFDYFGNCLKNSMENEVKFEFPFYVLRDSQVKVLRLNGCCFSLPSNNPRLLSLRSLSLENVAMTDQMLVDLMVACVNVEALVLSCVKGCKHFEIRSSKLRELTLKLSYIPDGSIEIVTPNLYALNMIVFHLGDYALTDVSSLVEANVSVGFYHCWVKIMRFLGHVQHLTLPNMWAELLGSKDVNSECFKLHNLKFVELHTCYSKSNLIGITQLLVLSPNLQTLVLANGPVLIIETWEESISEDFISQLSFNLPSLRYVKMKSFTGTDSEKYLILALLKTSVILERMVIIPEEVGEETPKPPIILKCIQDFEYFVRDYPKHKTFEERYQVLES